MECMGNQRQWRKSMQQGCWSFLRQSVPKGVTWALSKKQFSESCWHISLSSVNWDHSEATTSGCEASIHPWGGQSWTRVLDYTLPWGVLDGDHPAFPECIPACCEWMAAWLAGSHTCHILDGDWKRWPTFAVTEEAPGGHRHCFWN